MSDGKKGRRRRSSSLIYQEPPESIEHMSDQSALPNLNANWVNAKGTSRFRLQVVYGAEPQVDLYVSSTDVKFCLSCIIIL